MVASDKTKEAPLIKDYKEYHTDTAVHFVITMAPEKLADMENDNTLRKRFKMDTTVTTNNMVLFDQVWRCGLAPWPACRRSM